MRESKENFETKPCYSLSKAFPEEHAGLAGGAVIAVRSQQMAGVPTVNTPTPLWGIPVGSQVAPESQEDSEVKVHC